MSTTPDQPPEHEGSQPHEPAQPEQPPQTAHPTQPSHQPPPGHQGYQPPPGYQREWGYQGQPGYQPQPEFPGYQGQPGSQGQAGFGNFPSYPGGETDRPAATSAPPDDPLVPANFGGWFQRIVDVVRRSFVPLAILQVVTAVVSAVFGIVTASMTPNVGDLQGLSARLEAGEQVRPEEIAAATNGVRTAMGPFVGVSAVGGLILAVVGLFVAVASVYVAVRDASGQPTSAGQGVRFAGGRVLPLLGWGVLAGIITMIGFVLFILPGLYLMIVFGSTLLGVVVIERQGIGRCFALANARFLPTTGRVLLAGVILAVYALVVGIIAVGIGGGPGSVVTPIVRAILMIPLGIAGTAFAVVTYAELRGREGSTTGATALAAEMVRP